MSALAVAIQRNQWEMASLCLLLGVVEAASALPPDAVEGLLEVLAGPGGPREGGGGGSRPRGGARSFDRTRAGRGQRR